MADNTRTQGRSQRRCEVLLSAIIWPLWLLSINSYLMYMCCTGMFVNATGDREHT